MPIYPLQPVKAPWYLVEGDPYNFAQQSLAWAGAGYVTLSHVYTPVDMRIDRYLFYVDTSSGNYDVGLYSGSIGALTKVWSSGSTAMPIAGRQLVTIATPFVLPAGHYWSAFCVDNSTAVISASSVSGSHVPPLISQRISANKFPLPASMADSSVNYDKRHGPIWINAIAPAP